MQEHFSPTTRTNHTTKGAIIHITNIGILLASNMGVPLAVSVLIHAYNGRASFTDLDVYEITWLSISLTYVIPACGLPLSLLGYLRLSLKT